MILNSAQDLLESGIPFEDTKKIIENSIEESVDAYSVKKVFDVILETQQEGIPTESGSAPEPFTPPAEGTPSPPEN